MYERGTYTTVKFRGYTKAKGQSTKCTLLVTDLALLMAEVEKLKISSSSSPSSNSPPPPPPDFFGLAWGLGGCVGVCTAEEMCIVAHNTCTHTSPLLFLPSSPSTIHTSLLFMEASKELALCSSGSGVLFKSPNRSAPPNRDTPPTGFFFLQSHMTVM